MLKTLGDLMLSAGISLLIACATSAEERQNASTSGKENYQLVWSDEFTAEGRPDPKNWTYEKGFVRNNEWQWYQEENAFCRDGLLIIEGRRERVKNSRYEASSRDWRRNREYAEYSSACLTTRGRHSWTYGRLEICARFDAAPGLWPAIWTLGTARSWPGCGEIDIMEFYRGSLLANVAWANKRGHAVWDETKRPLNEWGANWNRKFHVWALDWNADSIRISVDGQLLNETDLSKAVNADRDRTKPFQEPHYLLLNLAIGGTQGGDPSKTEFPARFEVDYVRVFQRRPATP